MKSHVFPPDPKPLNEMSKDELITLVRQLYHTIHGKQALIDKLQSDAGWAADARRDELERQRLAGHEHMGS